MPESYLYGLRGGKIKKKNSQKVTTEVFLCRKKFSSDSLSSGGKNIKKDIKIKNYCWKDDRMHGKI